MKKICLINCYFGKLPNYFELWLESCTENSTVDFILFTDDKAKYKYPSNVKVIYTTFEEIKNKIQKFFEFKIELDFPYKLCDFKPTYGLVFKEYLEEYDFWGHCDLDLIFGDIRKYLDEDILDKYDKIYSHGHFSLYRNNKEINENFMELLDDNGIPLYENVFKSNNSFFFDETNGIVKLYDSIKYKMYKNPYAYADVSIKFNNFHLVSRKEDGNYIFYKTVLNNISKIYGYYINNGKIEKREFMYVHLQKRKMQVETQKKTEYMIVPNKFINQKNNQTVEDMIKEYGKKYTIYRKEYVKFKYNNLRKKIIRMIKL